MDSSESQKKEMVHQLNMLNNRFKTPSGCCFIAFVIKRVWKLKPLTSTSPLPTTNSQAAMKCTPTVNSEEPCTSSMEALAYNPSIRANSIPWKIPQTNLNITKMLRLYGSWNTLAGNNVWQIQNRSSQLTYMEDALKIKQKPNTPTLQIMQKH